jgi:hypothetical protein
MELTEHNFYHSEETVFNLVGAFGISEGEAVELIHSAISLHYGGKIPNEVWELLDHLRITFDVYYI